MYRMTSGIFFPDGTAILQNDKGLELGKSGSGNMRGPDLVNLLEVNPFGTCWRGWTLLYLTQDLRLWMEIDVVMVFKVDGQCAA